MSTHPTDIICIVIYGSYWYVISTSRQYRTMIEGNFQWGFGFGCTVEEANYKQINSLNRCNHVMNMVTTTAMAIFDKKQHKLKTEGNAFCLFLFILM